MLADYHSDQAKVDYIINEFDYFWETPYGITDKAFPTCSVDRPSNGDTKKLMGIMNHMLNHKIGDIVFPNMLDAASTNSLASIQKQVDLCKSHGKPQPNVVLVSLAAAPWVLLTGRADVLCSLTGSTLARRKRHFRCSTGYSRHLALDHDKWAQRRSVHT